MIFRLQSIDLDFSLGRETISLVDFNVFYGEMGAGKSSIARLIDYCLGGDIELTPALQSEFVSSTLSLELARGQVTLERSAGSNQIRVAWTEEDQQHTVLLPARAAGEELIDGTGVENLSDFIFWQSNIVPPKVRRSKVDEDSALQRLSFRDLFWYCYLDQESFDSEFFYLEKGAHHFKQLKSRDVLRYVLGYHQERVAELESRLEVTRSRRQALQEAAKALRSALDEVEVGSPDDLVTKQKILQAKTSELNAAIAELRALAGKNQSHAADKLREEARNLHYELETADLAVRDIRRVIAENTTYLNELKTLEARFRRNTSARAILNQVDFAKCPRCAQVLPERLPGQCHLCDQPENKVEDNAETELVQQDIRDRQSELEATLKGREQQLRATLRQTAELQAAKRSADNRLDKLLEEYDSAYLSSALEYERERAAVNQELVGLARLLKMARKVEDTKDEIGFLIAEEGRIKEDLVTSRQAAEKNTGNLRRLESLFLDCLVRTKITGFSETSRVTIKAPYLIPEVHGPDDGAFLTMSFSNMGSGGIKTLFKACFSVAFHRLAEEIGANLPSFLMLDTPMKNISEVTNRTQFKAFYVMLYELANGELSKTQFIVIDNSFYPPTFPLEFDLAVREMVPLSVEHPPLIPYYKGLDQQ